MQRQQHNRVMARPADIVQRRTAVQNSEVKMQAVQQLQHCGKRQVTFIIVARNVRYNTSPSWCPSFPSHASRHYTGQELLLEKKLGHCVPSNGSCDSPLQLAVSSRPTLWCVRASLDVLCPARAKGVIVGDGIRKLDAEHFDAGLGLIVHRFCAKFPGRTKLGGE